MSVHVKREPAKRVRVSPGPRYRTCERKLVLGRERERECRREREGEHEHEHERERD